MPAKQYDLWIQCDRENGQIRDVCRLCAKDNTEIMRKFARKTTMVVKEKKKCAAALSAQDKQKSL